MCRRGPQGGPGFVLYTFILIATASVEGHVGSSVVVTERDASSAAETYEAPVWLTVGRQYAPSAGGALLETVFKNVYERDAGGPLLEYDFESFDWGQGRQVDGSMEFRLVYPLDPSVPTLRWRQQSLPTYDGAVLGFDPLDVPEQDTTSLTYFSGLRRASYTAGSGSTNTWAMLDGCASLCGFPSFGVTTTSDNGLLPGPCGVNDTALWEGERTAPSGCYNVKAVELQMRQWSLRRSPSEVETRIHPQASCRLGDWLYTSTSRGLARSRIWSTVRAQEMSLLGDACDVAGASVHVSCRTGDTTGLLYDPTLSSICVVDADGIEAFNTSVPLSKGVYVDHVHFPTGTADFTLALWAKYTGYASSGVEDLLMMNGVVLRVLADTDPSVLCGLGDATTVLNATTTYNTTWAALGQLHHYACVRSEYGTKLSLYVDGAPVDVQYTELPYSLPSSTTVGSSGGVASSAGGATAAFLMDDLRVYKRALRGVEVASLAASECNGPAAAVLCDAADGVVYFGSSDTSQQGTCRVRAFNVRTEAIEGVRRSCPALGSASQQELHSFRQITGISKSGRDLVVTGSASHAVALVPIDDDMSATFLFASASKEQYQPGLLLAVSCSDVRGNVYHINGHTKVVSVLRNRYSSSAGFEPLFSTLDVDEVAGPVSSCTGTLGSLFLSDRWGVVQVDLSSLRGSRVVGFSGGVGTGFLGAVHDGTDPRMIPFGPCVSVTMSAGTLHAVADAGTVLQVRDLLHDTAPVFSLLYGQPGEEEVPAVHSSASVDYTAMITNVQTVDEHVVSVVESDDPRTCALLCNGASVCEGFVWYSARARCELVATTAFVVMPHGTGVYYKRPSDARAASSITFASHARLASATAAGALDVVPHSMCELEGALYILGGHRLLRVNISSGGVEHIAGNGLSSDAASADVTPASPATQLTDGALLCTAPDTVLLAQMRHSCVRSLNTTTMGLTTVVGSCGTIGNTTTSSLEWISSTTPLGVPTGLAQHGTAGLVYVATPGNREVWEVDIERSLRRLAVLNGSTSDNGTTSGLDYPSGVAWRGGVDDDVLIADTSLIYAADVTSQVVSVVAGTSYPYVLDTDPTRLQLASIGYGDTPSSAHVVASVKPGLGHSGTTTYTPSLHAAHLAAFDADAGRLSLLKLPAPLHGVTLAPSSEGLLIGGASYGTPYHGAVYRVSNLHRSALRLWGGSVVAKGVEMVGGFGIELDVRFDVSVGHANWTCLVGYGGLVVGVLEDTRGTYVAVDLFGTQRVLRAAGLTDGLWHVLSVSYHSVAGVVAVSVDGVTDSASTTHTNTETPHLFVGCHAVVRSSHFGAHFSLTPTEVSVANITVHHEGPSSHWQLNGNLHDAGGKHFSVFDGAPSFVLGHELPRRGGGGRVGLLKLGKASLLKGAAVWEAVGPCGEAVRMRGGGAELGVVHLGTGRLELSLWVNPTSGSQPLLAAGRYRVYLDNLTPVATDGTQRCGAAPLELLSWIHISAVFHLDEHRVELSLNGAAPRTCGLTPAHREVSLDATFGIKEGSPSFSGLISGVVVSALPEKEVCELHCKAQGDNRLEVGPGQSLVGGVGGVVYYSRLYDVNSRRGQRLVGVAAQREDTSPGVTGSISVGGWVRPRARATQAGPMLLLAHKGDGRVDSYSGRWCVDNQLGDLSGNSLRTNASQHYSGTPAPHGRMGQACTHENEVSAAHSWTMSASASMWVKYSHVAPAWPQPLLRWSSANDVNKYVSIVAEPSQYADYGATLQGQWCTNRLDAAADTGPFRRHLAPTDLTLDAAQFGGEHHIPQRGGGYSGVCSFPEGKVLATQPKALSSTLRTYMGWVYIAPTEGRYQDQYVLLHIPLHMGVYGYTSSHIKFGVATCSEATGYCEAFLNWKSSDGMNGAVSSFPRQPVPIGAWTHIAATWSSSNVGRIYVNGELITRASIPPNTGVPDTIVLGGELSGNYLHGMAHDVRVYDGVLNSTQINTIAANREKVASVLKWRNGASAAEVTCTMGASPHRRWPSDEWVHITANWGRSRGSWVLEKGDHHEHMVDCGDTPPAALEGWLDTFEVMSHAAEDLKTTFPYHDVRLRSRQASTADARGWLAAQRQEDWTVAFFISPDKRPSLALRGMTTVQCPLSTPQLLLDTWTHIAATVSTTEVIWYYNGTAVCTAAVDTRNALTQVKGAARWFMGGSLWGGVFDGNLGSLFLFERVVSRAKLHKLMKGEADPRAPCALQSVFPLRADDPVDTLGFRRLSTNSDTTDDSEPLIFDPRDDTTLNIPNGWDGLASSPAATISLWVKPFPQHPHIGQLSVFLGSSIAADSKWAEGPGISHETMFSKRSRTVFHFSFEDDITQSAGHRPNSVHQMHNAVPAMGVHGGALRIRDDGYAKGLAHSAGGSQASGITIAFWAYHRRTETAQRHVSSRERTALYEVARENSGVHARSLIAFQSSQHVYYGFGTPEGVQGAEESQQVSFDRWHHVAVTVLGNGSAEVFVDGGTVWSGVANASAAPWVWDESATIAGRYQQEYRLDRFSNCGSPEVAFVHPMRDGSNSTFLVGSIEQCKLRCDVYPECAGFVYIHDGDAAPPLRCYFRTSTATSFASAHRDCYTKPITAPHLDVTLDELTVFDHALDHDRIAKLSTNDAIPNTCPDTIPLSSVMLDLPFEEQGGLFASPRTGGTTAAVDGGVLRSGHVEFVGRSSLSLLRGCKVLTPELSFGGGENLTDLIYAPLEGVPGRQYSLRVRVSNEGSEDRFMGLTGAGVGMWAGVRIPPSQNEWFGSVDAAPLRNASETHSPTRIVFEAGGFWDGNVTVHEIQMCATPVADPVCTEWGCTCLGASSLFGMGPGEADRGCADPAVTAWWVAHACTTFPSETHDACRRPRQAWSVSFWIKPVQSAEGFDVSQNCSLAHEVLRTAAHLTYGVWRVFLCDVGNGRLVVRSAMHGGVVTEWADQDRPEAAYLRTKVWTHLSLVIDGNERRLYRDGALVHTTRISNEVLRWHSSVQFFFSEANNAVLHVDDLVVLQGAFCHATYRRLRTVGAYGTVLQQAPCALGASSMEEAPSAVWAYLRFNDAWLSHAGAAVYDSSGNGRVFSSSAGCVTHAGESCQGALQEHPGGSALRIGARGIRPTELPPGGDISVAFWTNVADSLDTRSVRIFNTGSTTLQKLLLYTSGDKVCGWCFEVTRMRM